MDRDFKKRTKKAKVNKEKRIKSILCGEKKRGNWWRSGTEEWRGDKEEDRPSSLYPVGRDLGGEPPSYPHTGKANVRFSPPPHVCKSMCAFYIYREMWFIFWNFDLLKGFEIYTTIILLGQRWDKWCAYGRSPEQILIDCRERGWKHKTFTLHVSDRLSQTTAHTGKSQRLKPCINIIGNKKQGQGDCWITLQASYLSHHCLIRAG